MRVIPDYACGMLGRDENGGGVEERRGKGENGEARGGRADG